MTDYVKRTQEQAVATWINLLNQLRLDILQEEWSALDIELKEQIQKIQQQLIDNLTGQDANLQSALAQLNWAKSEIAKLGNRGGSKGIHGFIAEIAETAFENARSLLRGLDVQCLWVDDNGPVDLLRTDGTKIQMKFVQKNLALDAFIENRKNYPEFALQGEKSMPPKDFYEAIIRLWNMSEEEAKKLTNNIDVSAKGTERYLTYKNWIAVRAFFERNGFDPSDLEPSLLAYDEVQRNVIGNTIAKEEQSLKETNESIKQEIREKSQNDIKAAKQENQNKQEQAYQRSKPSLREGTKVAAVSATLEGGVAFCTNVAKKRKAGKKLSEFTAEDWKEVGIDTGISTAKGGIRGATVYTLSNFTATPANVATGLVTATFGVMAQAKQLRAGKVDTEEFLINSEALCLDVSISTVSAMLGQTLIPVPVLGAIIGNTAGMFLYDIAKQQGLLKEQKLIETWQAEISHLDEALEAQYQLLCRILEQNFKKFQNLMEFAFDPDVNRAFEASIDFARSNGVAEEKILKSKADIDRYFLD